MWINSNLKHLKSAGTQLFHQQQSPARSWGHHGRSRSFQHWIININELCFKHNYYTIIEKTYKKIKNLVGTSLFILLLYAIDNARYFLMIIDSLRSDLKYFTLKPRYKTPAKKKMVEHWTSVEKMKLDCAWVWLLLKWSKNIFSKAWNTLFRCVHRISISRCVCLSVCWSILWSLRWSVTQNCLV